MERERACVLHVEADRVRRGREGGQGGGTPCSGERLDAGRRERARSGLLRTLANLALRRSPVARRDDSCRPCCCPSVSPPPPSASSRPRASRPPTAAGPPS